MHISYRNLFFILFILFFLIPFTIPAYANPSMSIAAAGGLSRSEALPLCGGAGRGLREVRAVWLTTIGGIDWPRKKANTAEGRAAQQRELCQQLDGYQRAGINTIILQTRIRSTMIYPSRIEPFDEALTGHPGRHPGYDPLAFCIEECHKRGMECHAWLVCFPAGKFTQQKKYGNQAINVRRPDLVKRAKEEWIMDPAAPGTATYIADLCEEIVRNYDVDGVQLDYIRYPETSVGFKTSLPLSAKRENVTRVVRAVHDRVKSIRPWCKLSCSPVGKYADLPRQSSSGWNARDAVAQDAIAWLDEGLMDWLAPMMYFKGKHFYPFACDWKERANGKPIVPGLGIYFMAPNYNNWPLSLITQEMHFLRWLGLGHAFFRGQYLLDNTKGLYHFTCDFNAQPALWPAMTWIDSIAPAAPKVNYRREDFALHLSWAPVKDNDPQVPVRYNVYRLPRDKNLPPVLLKQGLRQTTFTYTPALPALLNDSILVTALDAYGNESACQ